MQIKTVLIYLLLVTFFVTKSGAQTNKCFILKSGPAFYNFYDKSGADISLHSVGFFFGSKFVRTKKLTIEISMELATFPSFKFLGKEIYKGYSVNLNYSVIGSERKILSQSGIKYGISFSIPAQFREYQIESNNKYSYIANMPQVGPDFRWRSEFKNMVLNYQLIIPFVGNTITEGYSGINHNLDFFHLSTFNKRFYLYSDLNLSMELKKMSCSIGYSWSFEHSTVNNNLSVWASHLIYFSVGIGKRKNNDIQ